ncbi:MAG: lipid A biosynthesis acyltransferase [Gammaproteobacteria bacterium]
MNASHQPVFQRRFLRPRYWPIWFVTLLSVALAFLPGRLRAGLGDVAGWLLYRIDSRAGRIARKNLSLCYPQLSGGESDRLLRQHFRIAAHILLGYGQLLVRSPQHLRRQFGIQGLEIVEQAVAAGKGIILLSPHFLAIEYAGQCLSQNHAMAAMLRLHSNPVMDWIVMRFRTRYGGEGYSHKASLLPLVKATRGGRWLMYFPDEDRGAKNSVFIPFYGVPKATIPLLGRLAGSCRAQVIPMLAFYSPERRRFSIEFLEPLQDFPTGDDAQDALRMNRLIEDMVSRDPAQYLWTAKIFRTRPPGEPGYY